MTSIAFDLSTIFVGAANDTPRGIDRVDMGYAKRMFSENEHGNLGVLPTISGGMGAMTADEARGFVALVERRWRERITPGDDTAFTTWLRQRLNGEDPPRPIRRRGRKPRRKILSRYMRLAWRARRALVQPTSHALPKGCVYVNTGQVLLHFGVFFRWLEQRPDVKPVLMLHDMIPIFYPEYSSPLLTREHQQALEVVTRRAAAMIATSETTAAEIREVLAKRGRRDMPIKVTRLPVDEAFLVERTGAPYVSEVPYFVIVGAIDQRKNHLMLLNVWRELARAHGVRTPKLVIVGMRSFRSEGVVNFMRRCPSLADHVIETNGLSTPAMRELIRDARALLSPSFTEGFGLPIVEALALGTPVIASDIPAHREVGGRFATYIHPLDGAAWLEELTARMLDSTQRTEARRAALDAFEPQTWTSYFEEILPFIHSL